MIEINKIWVLTMNLKVILNRCIIIRKKWKKLS